MIEDHLFSAYQALMITIVILLVLGLAWLLWSTLGWVTLTVPVIFLLVFGAMEWIAWKDR